MCVTIRFAFCNVNDLLSVLCLVFRVFAVVKLCFCYRAFLVLVSTFGIACYLCHLLCSFVLIVCFYCVSVCLCICVLFRCCLYVCVCLCVTFWFAFL